MRTTIRKRGANMDDINRAILRTTIEQLSELNESDRVIESVDCTTLVYGDTGQYVYTITITVDK